ncbi:MAG TPA: methyl-accepting chemotaxis protein [Paenalcaligenes sp.]|nr:methyl-accepting chemotaxis protein [Paenalcaligenes sp.]
MRRWFQFRNLKVRTSLLLVLFFFLFMLISGAALGVLSLRFANLGLHNIVEQQNFIRLVNEANEKYTAAQLFVEEAASEQSFHISLNRYTFDSAWDEDSTSATGVSDQTLRLLDRAEFTLQNSQEDFYAAGELVTEAGSLRQSYERMFNLYQQLTEEAFAQQVALIRQGDIAGYREYRADTTQSLESIFNNLVDHIVDEQISIVDEMAAQESQQFEWIVRIVAAGILASLLIAALAYVFLNKMVLRPLRQAGAHFERIANGDLTTVIESPSRNEIGVLYEAVERMQAGLVQLIYSIRAGVARTETEVRGIHGGALELSSRTEQQASALQETAASMEELAGTVRQNTENAQEADRVARDASAVAERAGGEVGSVVKVMEQITASSAQISEIVNVIDGIAFQTNILALNASVEAARAGEHGRGFAVVAGEVRSLAQRSAQAAQEIKALIEGSMEHVQQGAQQVSQAGAVVNEVVQAVHRVTTFMGEIAVASNEQNLGIEQVNVAVAQMDTAVRLNADLVESTVNAIEALEEQTLNLTEAVSEFNVGEPEDEYLTLDHEGSEQWNGSSYYAAEATHEQTSTATECLELNEDETAANAAHSERPDTGTGADLSSRRIGMLEH